MRVTGLDTFYVGVPKEVAVSVRKGDSLRVAQGRLSADVFGAVVRMGDSASACLEAVPADAFVITPPAGQAEVCYTQPVSTEVDAKWSWRVTARRVVPAALSVTLRPYSNRRRFIDVDSTFRIPVVAAQARPTSDTVPLRARIDSATALVKSAEGFVGAVAALTLTALGLWASLRKHAGSRAAPDGPPDAPPPGGRREG